VIPKFVAGDVMAIAAQTFRYDLNEDSGVATIALDRPDRLNALTFEVYRELEALFRAIGDEPAVRAIVLTGHGRGFCSGGDVEQIIGELIGGDYQQLLRFTRLTGALVLAIRRCPRPVIAALNGTVAGAGAVIACACDLRIAAPTARIAFLFTRVGLSGADMGASWLLPRIVGLGHASALLLGGEFISAEEAWRIGLYNQIVAAEQLSMAANELAKRMARGPRFALEISKDALEREAAMDLSSAIEHEAQIQAVCMQHPDFREAYEAFRDKRAPRFR
jgi:enoyl-CoA hydratase/carnithine racemase